MFDNYSYKKKCVALSVIFVMLSAAAYKRSFCPLFDTICMHNELQDKARAMQNKTGNVNQLRSEIALLDSKIGKGMKKQEAIRQEIVSFAVKQRGVSIYDLQPVHIFQSENNTITTNLLDVTGNINHLLALAYEYEKRFGLSGLVSMDFYTTKSNNMPDLLHLKIYFQNYESNQ